MSSREGFFTPMTLSLIIVCVLVCIVLVWLVIQREAAKNRVPDPITDNQIVFSNCNHTSDCALGYVCIQGVCGSV